MLLSSGLHLPSSFHCVLDPGPLWAGSGRSSCFPYMPHSVHVLTSPSPSFPSHSPTSLSFIAHRYVSYSPCCSGGSFERKRKERHFSSGNSEPSALAALPPASSPEPGSGHVQLVLTSFRQWGQQGYLRGGSGREGEVQDPSPGTPCSTQKGRHCLGAAGFTGCRSKQNPAFRLHDLSELQRTHQSHSFCRTHVPKTLRNHLLSSSL